MGFVGPNTLKHFVEKYFGDYKKIQDIGDGTVTDAIASINNSLISESIGIILASSSYTLVSNASCVFCKKFAAISVALTAKSEIPVSQALFAMNSYNPKFKGRLSIIYGADSGVAVWREQPDENGRTWCVSNARIPANTTVTIIGSLAVEPL